ncbi:NAD(P)-binding protein [Hysterangium stoloniferum]|nr:NAD(P)-binding protein [Hysterangium stoloniferum]
MSAVAANARRSIFVVAGVGSGGGTGGSSARLFAQSGYQVALIARNAEQLKKTAEEINASGGDAAAFPVTSYNHESLHKAFEDIKQHWKGGDIRASLFNIGAGVWKPFLDITPQEIKTSLDDNVMAAFAFARESILAFKPLGANEAGKRGTLLFTGATASLRGNVTTSAFSSSKFALRGLSQSLAKEFGKDDIHVAHVIIDGAILTDRVREDRNDPEWEKKEMKKLHPDSIAKSHLYLTQQDRSAWTWEIDLRPAHEKW